MDIGFFLLRPDAVVLIINEWIDVKDIFIGEEHGPQSGNDVIMAHRRLLYVKI
jgi:hypothetical protein